MCNAFAPYDFFIGGQFDILGDGTPAGNLAYYNSTVTKPFGHFDGAVRALAYDSSRSRLYVGGNFRNVSGSMLGSLVYYDFSAGSWNQIEGANQDTHALVVYPQGIFAGGCYSNYTLLRFNGSSVSLNYGLNGCILALAYSSWNQRIYIGGNFTQSIDSNAELPVVGYSEQTNGFFRLSAPATPQGQVYALFWNGSTLLVGGNFVLLTTFSFRNIAYYDGSSWNPLLSGFGFSTDQVRAILQVSSVVYATGIFNNSMQVIYSNNSAWMRGCSKIYSQQTAGYSLLPDSATVLVGGKFLYACSGQCGTTSIAKFSRLFLIYPTPSYVYDGWLGYGDTEEGSAYTLLVDESLDNSLALAGYLSAVENPAFVLYNDYGAYSYQDLLNPVGFVQVLFFDRIRNMTILGGRFVVPRLFSPTSLSSNLLFWDRSIPTWHDRSQIAGYPNSSSAVVNAIAQNLTSGDLFIGGVFSNISTGASISNIGVLRSNNMWSTLGTNSFSPSIYALEMHPNQSILYIGKK